MFNECSLPITFGEGHNKVLVRVEGNLLLVQRWKLLAIQQQLQVTNFAASLGRRQAGYPKITNRVVRQRSLDFSNYSSDSAKYTGSSVLILSWFNYIFSLCHLSVMSSAITYEPLNNHTSCRC